MFNLQPSSCCGYHLESTKYSNRIFAVYSLNILEIIIAVSPGILTVPQLSGPE